MLQLDCWTSVHYSSLKKVLTFSSPLFSFGIHLLLTSYELQLSRLRGSRNLSRWPSLLKVVRNFQPDVIPSYAESRLCALILTFIATSRFVRRRVWYMWFQIKLCRNWAWCSLKEDPMIKRQGKMSSGSLKSESAESGEAQDWGDYRRCMARSVKSHNIIEVGQTWSTYRFFGPLWFKASKASSNEFKISMA